MVDVMEDLMKFRILIHSCFDYSTGRRGNRVKTIEGLIDSVNKAT